MTEYDEPQAAPVVKVARDLREIENLFASLMAQAIHKATSPLMPGGEAMVALGPAASPSEWDETVAAGEFRHFAACPRLDHTRCRYVEHVSDQDGEPILQTLLFWSEQWRAEAGYELGRTPSVATETNFIRGALDWAWDNLAEWDDFARDIRQARVRLENLLYAGRRTERTRVVCNRCDAAPRLLVIRGELADGSDDRWKCPNAECGDRWFTADDVHRAHAAMLRSSGAETWVHQIDAIGTLRAQGRSERTVRAWLSEGVGSGYCDPVTHEVWVWWPELWTEHASTPTRNRASA